MGVERLLLTVAGSDRGTRLDQYLARAVPAAGHELSRRGARRLIERGAVHIDRKRVRVASRKVQPGSRVEIYLGETHLSEAHLGTGAAHGARPGPFELTAHSVLFEDGHLLALDKPSGLLTQASRDNAVHHLLAAAQRWLAGHGSAAKLRLLHRLDRGTSGVCLLAKTRRAAAGLSAAFERRSVAKVYRALCARSVELPAEEWEERRPLERRSSNGRVRVEVVAGGGQKAETRFRYLGARDQWFEVEARPVTGRTHQVRVHLAAAGLPVLGDRLYGGPPADRLMLHAWRLELEHPVSGEELTLESPLPEGWGEAGEGSIHE